MNDKYASMICAQGHINQAGDTFCGVCGSPLGEDVTAETVAETPKRLSVDDWQERFVRDNSRDPTLTEYEHALAAGEVSATKKPRSPEFDQMLDGVKQIGSAAKHFASEHVSPRISEGMSSISRNAQQPGVNETENSAPGGLNACSRRKKYRNLLIAAGVAFIAFCLVPSLAYRFDVDDISPGIFVFILVPFICYLYSRKFVNNNRFRREGFDGESPIVLVGGEKFTASGLRLIDCPSGHKNAMEEAPKRTTINVGGWCSECQIKYFFDSALWRTLRRRLKSNNFATGVEAVNSAIGVWNLDAKRAIRGGMLSSLGQLGVRGSLTQVFDYVCQGLSCQREHWDRLIPYTEARMKYESPQIADAICKGVQAASERRIDPDVDELAGEPNGDKILRVRQMTRSWV